MSKIKTTFFCQNCGSQYAKWQGQCNSCKEWNTIAEEIIQKEEKASWNTQSPSVKKASKPLKIHEIDNTQEVRMDTRDGELNRVLGGGIVPGSLILLGGEPGIGKSTLLLQLSLNLPYKTLYVSGEESMKQIKMRAERISTKQNSCYILTETKNGTIAGPKILEHMVDTVLQFEGDRNHVYRLLRSLKNRFGSTAELGIYEMLGSGLREVSNPSEILISHQDVSLSGTAISATLEGMRPLMIEIQALVSTAVYGTPQRSTTGYNAKRLNMILAVLEKRAGFRLGTKDVFLNITGGITIDDPAIDLAVVAAILSSNEDIAIEEGVCFAGEIGLSGEIRPVNRVEQRILEAEKLGFTTIFVSKYNKISLKNTGIRIQLVSKIEDVASVLFG